VGSTLAELGEERLFSAHMIQHLLLGDIAPLPFALAVGSRTGLAHPLVALAHGGPCSRVKAPCRPALRGTLFGTALSGLSYAALTPLRIYEAPWRCPARRLATDWSYHAIYGLGVAGAFEALER
jgi:hypothetical protein